MQRRKQSRHAANALQCKRLYYWLIIPPRMQSYDRSLRPQTPLHGSLLCIHCARRNQSAQAPQSERSALAHTASRSLADTCDPHGSVSV